MSTLKAGDRVRFRSGPSLGSLATISEVYDSGSVLMNLDGECQHRYFTEKVEGVLDVLGKLGPIEPGRYPDADDDQPEPLSPGDVVEINHGFEGEGVVALLEERTLLRTPAGKCFYRRSKLRKVDASERAPAEPVRDEQPAERPVRDLSDIVAIFADIEKFFTNRAKHCYSFEVSFLP